MKRLTKRFILDYARHNVGGLSDTSKMPCYSWSISADLCHMGEMLAKMDGSVCSKCYAKRGNYLWPNTVKAHQRRIDHYNSDNIKWREDMLLLTKYLYELGEDHFRWFDSGDIQSSQMLRDILWISERSPLKFWLPTKEASIVREHIRHDGIPKNTIVRVSAPMIGSRNTCNLSSDHQQIADAYVGVKDKDIFQCPAPSQDDKCGDCRMCWDTQPVSYKKI